MECVKCNRQMSFLESLTYKDKGCVMCNPEMIEKGQIKEGKQ